MFFWKSWLIINFSNLLCKNYEFPVLKIHKNIFDSHNCVISFLSDERDHTFKIQEVLDPNYSPTFNKIAKKRKWVTYLPPPPPPPPSGQIELKDIDIKVPWHLP